MNLKKFRKLFFLPLFIYFSVTTIVIRLVFFVIDRSGLPEPAIVIGGVHLHHYLFGIAILLLITLLSLHQKSSKKILTFFLGISLALIIDELQFLLKLAEVQYPTQEFKLLIITSFVFFVGAIAEYLSLGDKKARRSRISDYPLVSVVIPAYNEERFIAKTLRSLKRQNYPGKFEIVVVNNASTDKTAEVAKKLGVKVIFEPKKGVQLARQRGFQSAKGDLIASTDADNILPKRWLKKLAEELTQDQDLVAVGGWFKIKKGPLTSKLIINQLSPPIIRFYLFITRKKALIGQNFMLKKEAFLRCGGFPEFTEMDEDWELAERLKRIGKVKLHHGDGWKVLTSPRKWRNGFFLAVFPYLVNGLSYGLTNKLVFKKLSVVREEKTDHSPLKTAMSFAFMIIMVILLLASVTTASARVHDRFVPIAKKYEKKINGEFKKIDRNLENNLENRHSPKSRE